MRVNTIEAFFALVRVGLWSDVNPDIQIDGTINWYEVYQLAQEQSVQGLVLQGIEAVYGSPLVPKILLLQWIGEVQIIEQRNKAMNQFIADLVLKMRNVDIYTLLVKGQGIAQCYERPLWRPSGDIDFLVSKDNFRKAVAFLKSRYSNNKDGGRYSQEYAFYTDQWMIEVHGSLRTCLSSEIDKEVDSVQSDVFYGGNVRWWDNNGTLVFLPAPTEDVFFVFTHFIKHFYKEGMSMRQLCDWCRLLWTYRTEIKIDWLEKHVRKAGLMKEWQMFATLAVVYIGMPAEAMPFYDVRSKKNEVRGKKLIEFILSGSSGNKCKDTWQIAKIFPWKALRYSPSIFLNVNWLKLKERLYYR